MEQGAAVAVTKKFTIIALTGFMLLGYQNCTVDLASTTPGAASSSCNPDPTTLAEFQVVENTVLLPTGTISGGNNGCAYCHGTAASNSGKNVFLIQGTLGAQTTALSTKNFCAMDLKGATRLAHPQDASHSGGTYRQVDIPDYYTLINKYF